MEACIVGDVVVAKFGGSILQDGEAYLRASSVVKEQLLDNGYQPIIVVSAMKGVTDLLIHIADNGSKESLARIERMYFEALKEIVSLEMSSEYTAKLGVLLKDLERTVWAISVLGESTPRIKDYIVSHGEKLSAILMEAALRRNGVQSRWMNGGEAGIVTDDSYGEAKVLLEKASILVRERMTRLLEKEVVPVITGFIGETVRGDTTTLGRGGSDYSASLIGALVGASEVRLYTNVEGVMTGNPEKLRNARTIPKLSVEEAMELSYLGAKKFHPRTFEPLKLNSVPVRILSVYNPEGPSTVVQGLCNKDDGIKAVHVMDDLAVVKIKGPTMAGRIGTATEVMSLAREANVNISAISQPVSETVITLVVKEDKSHILAELAMEKLKPRGVVEEAEVETKISALGVVGCGLRENSKLGRILSYLDGLDVKLLARGLKGAGLSIVLPREEAWNAAEQIHEEVILNGQN